jgi:hypothetical protein
VYEIPGNVSASLSTASMNGGSNSCSMSPGEQPSEQ